jgi:hypothetical protein
MTWSSDSTAKALILTHILQSDRIIEPLMLAVLAQRSGQSPLTMTVGTFWTEVAHLGGYLARSHDGPPGWRTIWKGWLSLQTLLEGAHLRKLCGRGGVNV